MPNTHFAILSITQTNIIIGVDIEVTTNVPVHLWMRWSLQPPHIHQITRQVRGLAIPTLPYYCHVAYKDCQQLEAGDTLIHTFNCPPWNVCQTRYFTFWGTIDGLNSPSESAIFQWHKKPPLPGTEHEYYLEEYPGDAFLFRDSRHGQGFTPKLDYTIRYIAIPLGRLAIYTNGTWHVQLRTSQAGYPSATVLAQDAMFINLLPVHPSWGWFYFRMDDIQLEKDVLYYIVSFMTNYTYWWTSAFMKFSTNNNPYLRGFYTYTSYEGGHWEPDQGWDHGFLT